MLSAARGFADLFTEDKYVLFNYHGYATELQGLIFGRPGLRRMRVNGYCEEGTTTTPFDMMLRNGVSRYNVAERALRLGAESSPPMAERLEQNIRQIKERVADIKGTSPNMGG